MKLKCLNWKYGSGNSFNHLDEVTGKIIIDRWNHPTEPEPTEAEIQQISDEYEQHLIDQPIQDEKDYKKMKTKLKKKLDMDDSQFEIFEKFFKSNKQGDNYD